MIYLVALWSAYSFAPAVLSVLLFGSLWRTHAVSCFTYIIASWLATNGKLITYLLSPFVAALSVLLGWGNLPAGLNWMQTHDDDLDPKRQPLYRPTPTNPFVKWWWRTCWLCRNPAYGLMHNHFGVTTAQKLSVVVGTRVWKSGQPGIEKRIVPRHRGVQVRGNISVLGIKINVYLGWKLVRKDADGKRMLAIGVKLGWL